MLTSLWFHRFQAIKLQTLWKGMLFKKFTEPLENIIFFIDLKGNSKLKMYAKF